MWRKCVGCCCFFFLQLRKNRVYIYWSFDGEKQRTNTREKKKRVWVFLFAGGKKIKTNSRWHKLCWRRLNNHCLCRYRCCHRERSVLLRLVDDAFVSFNLFPCSTAPAAIVVVVIIVVIFAMFFSFPPFTEIVSVLLLYAFEFFSAFISRQFFFPLYVCVCVCGYLIILFHGAYHIGRVPNEMEWNANAFIGLVVFVFAWFPFSFLFTLK